MNASRAVLAMFLVISGCSSCNRTEEQGAGGAAATAPKAAQPAATAGKIQVAPPQPAAVRQPNAPAAGGGAPVIAPGGVEATPMTPPEAAQQPDVGSPPQPDDCVVVADVNPDFGPPPLSVTFTAEAECGQGATYKWDFGDGSPPSTEANPAHTYAKDGDYTASVTVTGPNGVSASDDIDIFVEQD
jgi:PKD repeat protein